VLIRTGNSGFMAHASTGALTVLEKPVLAADRVTARSGATGVFAVTVTVN
jgi:hypothetical protein